MKNILILAALSAVILTGCGNISPPFKAEQTTVTTAAPTVSAAASSEAESTVDEEQVKYDTFIAEFFDSNICFADTSALVTEAMKGSSFENEIDNSNGVNKITLKGSNGGGTFSLRRGSRTYCRSGCCDRCLLGFERRRDISAACKDHRRQCGEYKNILHLSYLLTQ
jgi:hypothetical protein